MGGHVKYTYWKMKKIYDVKMFGNELKKIMFHELMECVPDVNNYFDDGAIYFDDANVLIAKYNRLIEKLSNGNVVSFVIKNFYEITTNGDIIGYVHMNDGYYMIDCEYDLVKCDVNNKSFVIDIFNALLDE